jgi:YVTN family beta-propeller protein
MRPTACGVLGLIFCFTPLCLTHAESTPPSYRLISTIPIKGQGGWDALTVDPASHRLFVSHADRVVVIDTQTDQVIKEIVGTPGVHAIAIAPAQKKAFVTNGKDSSVAVIDLGSLTIKNKIKVGENPDLILDNQDAAEVYCFNGRSKSVSIIRADTEKVVDTVALPGKPEFATLDAAVGRVYVNIEDKNSILALDTKSHKVVSIWPILGCDSPSGIAIDSSTHHLFSVCENEKMFMVDSENGKTIASVPTGEGTDGAAFDPVSGLAFSSNGKTGTITVAREESDNKISVVQTVNSQVGARTLALDPSTHKIYLPTADFERAKDGKRPKPIDGTQRVLVYAPKGSS